MRFLKGYDMKQIISIAQHNEKRQDIVDAVKWLAEAENDLVIARQEFKIAEESTIADNCHECEGTGQVEFRGDPAHNPTGVILHRDCPICEGKGYLDGTEIL